jgi:hypothetical protein
LETREGIKGQLGLRKKLTNEHFILKDKQFNQVNIWKNKD